MPKQKMRRGMMKGRLCTGGLQAVWERKGAGGGGGGGGGGFVEGISDLMTWWEGKCSRGGDEGMELGRD